MSPLEIHIPQELFNPSECKHYEGTAQVGIVKVGPDIYDFKEPVSWQVDITNTGGALLVTGTAEGKGTVGCARCLEPVEIDLTGDIEGYFVITPDAAELDDLEEDEFEVLGEDKIIDMAPLIQAALILDFPQIPLCRDDCKGICPECGANLNEGDCSCAQNADSAVADERNPFSVLKNYEFDN